MPPVFVSELFRLLERVGMPWQTVGRKLRLPRTPLSLWRHGRRPISRKYAAPLVCLAIDAVNEALARAKALDLAAPVQQKRGATILTQTPTRETALAGDLWEIIGRWDAELYHTTGRIDEDSRKWLEVISEYRQRDVSKLETFDLERLLYAVNRIKANAAEVLRWRGESESVELVLGYKPSGVRLPSGEQTPAERIAELARAVGIKVDCGRAESCSVRTKSPQR